MKSEKTVKLWQASRHSNLVRYVPSGTYFIRAKVHGKLIRESLETDVEEVARLKLGDRLKTLRMQPVTKSAAKLTFADATKLYLASIEVDRELKPLSKEYRRDTCAAILRMWPAMHKAGIRSITSKDCAAFAAKVASEYSPTRFNGMMQTLRAIFDSAMAEGAVADNPAKGIAPASVKPKELSLPTQAQFLKILETMDARDNLSPGASDLVRLLAYSGMRKSEARNLTWPDVDFDKGQIRVKGDPIHGTKNSESRTVPMIEDLRALLERRRKPDATGRIIELNECRYSLEKACEIVGCPRITHHDLRHLFATRCIESGVDIPTVSRWLGHKDGGALAMKTYGHLRDEHSTAMAQKVSFGRLQP